MKTTLLLAIALAAVPFSARASVAPGATLDEVRAALGVPNGEVRVGSRHVLYFDRGSVEFANQRAVRIDLRTTAEQAALEVREQRLQAELEARQSEMIAEGTALRDEKLADDAFRTTPAAYQVAFWEDFVRRYPGVPAAEPLALARLKREQERAERLQKAHDARRIAELEGRLAAAEQRPLLAMRRYYRGAHDRYEEFALWPVRYTYYDSPLPVYTTPGAPANGWRGEYDFNGPTRSNDRSRIRHPSRADRDSRWKGRGHEQRGNAGRF